MGWLSTMVSVQAAYLDASSLTGPSRSPWAIPLCISLTAPLTSGLKECREYFWPHTAIFTCIEAFHLSDQRSSLRIRIAPWGSPSVRRGLTQCPGHHRSHSDLVFDYRVSVCSEPVLPEPLLLASSSLLVRRCVDCVLAQKSIVLCVRTSMAVPI